ncbi:MAG: histidine ammonia-lyase [Dehalococcoidia bacterium]
MDGASLSLAEVVAVAREGASVELDPFRISAIADSRAVVDKALSAGHPIYGINTGFGQLSDIPIAADQLEQLQVNLLRSHAVGVGEPLRVDEVRAMILLRANSLARGVSGVRLELIQFLIEFLNRGVHPVVPSQGSVGSSGDLAPLAHMALVLVGEGQALYQSQWLSGAEALDRAGLQPLTLQAKEGLALINGTQLMAGVGALVLHDALALMEAAETAAAVSIDALMGTSAAFHAAIQEARGQPGQIASARRLRALLEGSEIGQAHRKSDHKVQDAYSLRCAPQVFGAVRDAIEYVRQVIGREVNAATDNPLVFAGEGEIISGGNFHGQPVALALDVLGLGLTQLGNFSERRTYKLLSPQESGLPAFLTKNPGINSGLMITQYTAAALASENKVLAHPASADSIPTSAGQEDFNSMGAAAAMKARRICDNVATIIAIELICAAQGLDFRRPLRSSAPVERAHSQVRAIVPELDEDRSLSREIQDLAAAVIAGQFGARLLSELPA